jgi:hypothetical protein
MHAFTFINLLIMLVAVQGQQLTMSFASNECAGDAGQFFYSGASLCFPTGMGASRGTECRSDGKYYVTEYTSSATCSGTGTEQANFTSPLPCDSGSQTYCASSGAIAGVPGKFDFVSFTFSGDSCTIAEATNVVGLAVDFCSAARGDTSTKLVKEGGQYVEYTYAGLECECAGTPTETSTIDSTPCISFPGLPGKVMVKLFDPPVSLEAALAAVSSASFARGSIGLVVAMMAVLCVLMI